jgi:hypothetical protein
LIKHEALIESKELGDILISGSATHVQSVLPLLFHGDSLNGGPVADK